MYHYFFKLLLSIILLSSTLLANETNTTAKKDETTTITSRAITFKGYKDIPLGELESAIGVDNKSAIEFWKDDNPRIKDKLIPTLGDSLRSFYDSEGYYDANFTISTTDKLVTVTVDEDKPVLVTDINISSDYNLTELITFSVGEVFKAKKFINIKNSIAQALLKEGYCSYDLDNKAYVDLDKREVKLQYKLRKDGICTFGKVTIKGLERIDDAVVVSRVRAREGKTFSTERIQESYDALYALDAFDIVAVKYDRKFYNVVPVDIVVKEITKKNYFMGGLGYDTNVGAGIRSEYIRKNFFGDAQKLKIKASYSKIEQLIELTHYMPAYFNIWDYSIDLVGKIGYSNLEYEGFMEEKSYLQTYLAYTNEKLSLQAGISLENIDITLLDNIDEEKLTQAISDGTFFLIYPFMRFSYDRRDSKINPKYGYYFAGMVEYGIDYDSDSSSYLKYTLEGRFIHTFGDLTLATVGKVGILDELANSVPESKRFFAGGVYSNRAYGYNRVGVILSPERYGLDGASTMANLSVEADYPIVGDLYGAIFTDNTMLTLNSYDFTGDILTSAGFGVRYLTPIGPIKLDVGMNIHDPSQYGISFQIGQSF